jgi:hypothetical protein
MSANPHQAEMFGPEAHQEAVERRDDGIARALEHAEQETPDWRVGAIRALECFLRERGNLPFLAEVFRVFATSNALVEEPPDARAWGAVMTRAKKLGLVESCGAGRAITSNLSFKVLWKKK